MIVCQRPTCIARYSRTYTSFLLYAKNIRAKLKGNVILSNPTPSLVVYSADLDAFDAAQTLVAHGSPADVADRNAKSFTVYQDVGHIVDYVQGVSDKQPSVAESIAVILSGGLDVRKTSTFKKPELAAKHSGFSGQVVLVALAIAEAGAYFWETSVDQKLWLPAPETKASKTLILGLTPGVLYYFRFRALTPKGKGDYSQIVSLIAH